MAPIIRAVRAKKAPNLGLQRGFSLSGTLQERLFTGSRVLNEVVLRACANRRATFRTWQLLSAVAQPFDCPLAHALLAYWRGLLSPLLISRLPTFKPLTRFSRGSKISLGCAGPRRARRCEQPHRLAAERRAASCLKVPR